MALAYNFISLAHSHVSYDVGSSTFFAGNTTQHYVGCSRFILYHENHVYSGLCETYNVQWRGQCTSA